MKIENSLLVPGLSASMEELVSEKHTAKYWGSGKSNILATPALVALMEACSQKIVDKYIPADWQSIGTAINLRHDSATPTGIRICVKASLSVVEGRKLSFEISAFDETGQIAQGTHHRVISKTLSLERLLKRKK